MAVRRAISWRAGSLLVMHGGSPLLGGGVAGAVTLQGPAAALCSHLHLGGPEGVRLSESPEAAAGARNQARGTRAPCYCWGGAACFSISASALGAPEVLVADLRKIPSS